MGKKARLGCQKQQKLKEKSIQIIQLIIEKDN